LVSRKEAYTMPRDALHWPLAALPADNVVPKPVFVIEEILF